MKKITLLWLLSMSISLFSFAQIKTGKEIAVTSTNSGKVRGLIRSGIYTYKGIPYAFAKRFEAPQKPEAWEGVRSSMTWGPVAPLLTPTTQVADEIEFVFDHDWGYTSEDCLVLNVWTPGINDGKKRPVLFWIHGGGYVAGSSQELPSYHGENLAKKGDVVVVSINHRLNVLGFLDLSAYNEKYKTSANNSILDMRTALEWVHENISNFGGDPSNVTIFGQSGGGAKVNTLMAMPSAKRLFHKAVNQSGSFRLRMLEKEITSRIASETLKELDISETEVNKIQSVPYRDLAKAATKALKTIEEQMKAEGKSVGGLGFGLSWGPSVDGALLPYQMFSDEAFELSKEIPLMIGTVKNEFMASLRSGMTNASEAEVLAAIKQQRGDQADAYVSAVKKAYPNSTLPSDLLDVDMMFRPGAVYQAEKKSKLKGGAPVYSYLFAWQSPVMNGKYKAIHCMELPFVFDNIDRCENMTGATPEAHALADKVSQAWINFARHGNPNHKGLPDWPAFTADNGANMIFDNKSEVRYHHDKALLDMLSQNQNQ